MTNIDKIFSSIDDITLQKECMTKLHNKSMELLNKGAQGCRYNKTSTLIQSNPKTKREKIF